MMKRGRRRRHFRQRHNNIEIVFGHMPQGHPIAGRLASTRLPITSLFQRFGHYCFRHFRPVVKIFPEDCRSAPRESHFYFRQADEYRLRVRRDGALRITLRCWPTLMHVFLAYSHEASLVPIYFNSLSISR